MVRTKGDGGAARSVGAKAPRKALGGGGSSGAASRAIASAASPRGGTSGGGGAGYNPMGQPVPGWQKKMTSFFKSDPNAPLPPKKDEGEGEEDDEEESQGKGKKLRNTDEDEENDLEGKVCSSKREIKKNGVVDESDGDD